MNRKLLFAIRMGLRQSPLLMLLLLSLPLCAADITATVTGFENSDGRLRFSMFSKSRQGLFPMETGKADYVKEAEINGGEAIVKLSDVTAGEYAVFVYHDSNNNNDMDHHWYGPPIEAFGYYTPFKVKLMPPDFDEVSFRVTDSDMEITVPLQVY